METKKLVRAIVIAVVAIIVVVFVGKALLIYSIIAVSKTEREQFEAEYEAAYQEHLERKARIEAEGKQQIAEMEAEAERAREEWDAQVQAMAEERRIANEERQAEAAERQAEGQRRSEEMRSRVEERRSPTIVDENDKDFEWTEEQEDFETFTEITDEDHSANAINGFTNDNG